MFTLVLFLFLGSTCTQVSKPDQNVHIDYEFLKRALAEVGIKHFSNKAFLVFPMKGCNSCSEVVVEHFSEQVSKIDFCNLTVIVSGDSDAFIDKIKQNVPHSSLVIDNKSILLRYSVVSIYPILIKLNENEVTKVVELQSSSIEEAIDLLDAEILLTTR
jgi:fructose-1-phosphate kinase PfkB-like protein